MFDGGARGNPGVAGSGSSVIVQDVTNATNAFRRTVYIRYYVGDNATNNQAEYQGLLYGLASAQREARLFAQSQSQLLTIDLIVQGDSNLIIEQLKGNYSCKSEKLKPLFRKAKQMLASFSNVGQCTFSLEHVYRKDNKVADGTLVN
jgi:ribonuclease HI